MQLWCGGAITAHLQASWYLNKLPLSFAADDRVLVSDPMMATGGTMVQVAVCHNARVSVRITGVVAVQGFIRSARSSVSYMYIRRCWTRS